MKQYINFKDNVSFSKLTGDYNKIHINKKFARKFFFKYCIAHGVNVVAICLSKFLQKNKNNNFFISKIKVKFFNYIEIGEDFNIYLFKNSIIVKNEINKKLEINVNYIKYPKKKLRNRTKLKSGKYFFNNLQNQDLITELLNLSKKIGTKLIGNGSLFLNICVNAHNNKKKKNVIKRLNKNAFNYYLNSKAYSINALIINLQPYKNDKIKLPIVKKYKRYLKDKSILIFGSNGILGSFTKNYFAKYKSSLYLVNKTNTKSKKSFIKNYSFNSPNFYKLKRILKITCPDYIFYFISPKIMKSDAKKINSKLYNLYKYYYVTLFSKMLEIVKKFNKKIYIFYPSTVALNEKIRSYKYSNEYKITKYLGEKICKKKKTKNIIPIFYRIGQIKSPQNYNIAGFYEGQSSYVLKKHIDNFIFRSLS